MGHSQAKELLKLESALLRNAAVIDCAVRSRTAPDDSASVVAYLVPGPTFAEGAVRASLEAELPNECLPDAFVLLSALPITAEGNVDDEALAAFSPIDEHAVKSCEQALLAVPGIEKAAVFVETRSITEPPLHIADLLPDVKPASGVQTHSAARSASRSEAPQESTPAIAHGAPLLNAESLPQTLQMVLKRAAEMKSDHGILYVQPDEKEVFQSYAELRWDAERMLGGLRKLGLKPHDKVIFQFDRNQDFIPAFWACMLGGFVPAPVSIAPTYRELNSTIQKLHHGWQLLGRPLVLAGDELAGQVRHAAGLLDAPELQVIGIGELRAGTPDKNWYESDPNDVCLLLLTSGSTGVPKAVQQRHCSLIHRSAATAQMNNFGPGEVSINWFPLDHVGGIVMFHLMDLFAGAQQIQVPTELVLSNPLKWLDLIERHRATVTWAPNFAFGLIKERERELKQRRWDLSSMRFILNGGEAIVPATLCKFMQLLAPHGLRPDAMHPAWGMSETCSGVAFSGRCSADSVRDEDAFVSVGEPVPGVSLRIVDATDQVIEEGKIGRLQVSGPPVTVGYYNNSEANRQAFTRDGWFDTGDLAYLSDGQLTITGRAKDVIIINGVNFYSQEIEAVVEEVEGVEVSFTAACAVRAAGKDTDCLAVFFHTPIAAGAPLHDLLKRIREHLLRKAGVLAEFLVPLPQSEIPKTAIGKIQRTQLRERFEANRFSEILKKLDVESGGANTVPSWFYRKVWRCRQAIAPDKAPMGTVLIFEDSLGLAQRLADELSGAGAHCIRIAQGERFRRLSADAYEIDLHGGESYRELIRTLTSSGERIANVIHCGAYETVQPVRNTKELREAQYRGAYSLLFLIQALAAEQQPPETVRLFAITRSMQPAIEGEPIAPTHATIPGLLASVALEVPWLLCRHVDLQHESSLTESAAAVLQELAVSKAGLEAAYRNGRRFVPSIEPLDMLGAPVTEAPIKAGGLYLITGGLGGLGTELARHLMTKYNARLLLLGRTEIATQAQAPSGIVAKRIRNYKLLEESGGEFLYRACDISRLDELTAVVLEAERRWGTALDGIFHLAGNGSWVGDQSLETFEETFSPKVYGTWALFELLKKDPEALFVSFSSITGLFGGATYSAYAAANSFLDAFSLSQRFGSRPRTYCFNWSIWDELGMSESAPGYAREMTRSMGYKVIPKEQGLRSLFAGLRRKLPQVIVGLDGNSAHLRKFLGGTPKALQQLSAYYESKHAGVKDEIAQAERLRRPPLAAVPTQFIAVEELPIAGGGASQSLQADAQRAIVAPANDLEAKLVRIWRDVLNLPQVSTTATFSELGGDSLLAMRIINRMRETFGVTLSLRTLFEMPTIAELAAVIDSVAVHPAAAADIERQEINPQELLSRIDSLSEQEMDALLAQMTAREGTAR